MPSHREKLSVSGDRTSIRNQVIMKFLAEEPGTGTGEKSSKYIYEVETSKDGMKVILKRPAPLNKGVDFTVHVEGLKFRQRGMIDMPSHTDILKDLYEKKTSNPVEYKKVHVLINKIYNCESVDEHEFQNIAFSVGHPIEIILKAIKWLFIEQDVTYWNWSGRKMLYSAMHNEGLC